MTKDSSIPRGSRKPSGTVPGGGILALFRHGPAEKRDAERHPDDDLRPLTRKGRKRVRECAEGLRALGFVPRFVYASPALRTRETAEILAKVFGIPPRAVRIEPALHHTTSFDARHPRLFPKPGKRVLWVGHEPWLGEALGRLVGAKALPLRKAGCAIVRLGEGGLRRSRLEAFWSPGDLAAVGESPAHVRRLSP